MSPLSRGALAGLLCAGAAGIQGTGPTAALLEERTRSTGSDKFAEARGAGRSVQTPEELGFSADGEQLASDDPAGAQFSKDHCLDLGAKGFPLPVFDMMQAASWNANMYFDELQAKGYADDALQMTGPQDALLKSDCMKANFHGKVKHIFVGDSQMMTLRNAFHRHNKCPEIWWTNSSQEQAMLRLKANQKYHGRLHSSTEQAPQVALPKGCSEEGVASYIFWDAWASPEIPVREIRHEMEAAGLSPKEGDTVVVWIGSNHISATRRLGVLEQAVQELDALGVKMVWDSPTLQDAVIMSAASAHDAGRDPHNDIPITFNAISGRKAKGLLGSNEYRTERAFLESGRDVPMTKRWQLTNRYRGLQCDGMHNDIRGRDPLFYSAPCPAGEQPYGESVYCNWVEPFNLVTASSCPQAIGLDDLVLQSGLYSLCNTHETPFCYQQIGAKIR